MPSYQLLFKLIGFFLFSTGRARSFQGYNQLAYRTVNDVSSYFYFYFFSATNKLIIQLALLKELHKLIDKLLV